MIQAITKTEVFALPAAMPLELAGNALDAWAEPIEGANTPATGVRGFQTWGRSMKRILSVAVGMALLGFVAGCGGGSDDDSAPATTQPSSYSVTSTPAPPTPAGPLTAAQYQASLTQLDGRLAPGIKALSTANSAENLIDAMASLAQTLDTEASRLVSVKPPANIVPAHKTLQARLKAASSSLSGAQADNVNINAKCGGVVYTSQNVQRKLTADLAAAVAALRKLGLRFGTTLPKLGPEPPDRRPSNGDILVRSGTPGSGRLQVKNGTTKDVAISIVTDGKAPTKPHVMMYVQARKIATISQIGGKYHIYFKSGSDWNPKRRQFSTDCRFQKFDQGFGRNEGWQINLQPSSLGNASTSDVDTF